VRHRTRLPLATGAATSQRPSLALLIGELSGRVRWRTVEMARGAYAERLMTPVTSVTQSMQTSAHPGIRVLPDRARRSGFASSDLALAGLHTAPARVLWGVQSANAHQPTQSNLDSNRAIFDQPTGAGFIALLERFRATGGTAPSEIVDHLLAEHHADTPVSLHQLIANGHVFGFTWRAALWIPMFQFDADHLSVRPTVQSVLAALPADWSGWTIARWFATANERLGGGQPVDSLDADANDVLAAAQWMQELPSLGALESMPALHAAALAPSGTFLWP